MMLMTPTTSILPFALLCCMRIRSIAAACDGSKPGCAHASKGAIDGGAFGATLTHPGSRCKSHKMGLWAEQVSAIQGEFQVVIKAGSQMLGAIMLTNGSDDDAEHSYARLIELAEVGPSSTSEIKVTAKRMSGRQQGNSVNVGSCFGNVVG